MEKRKLIQKGDLNEVFSTDQAGVFIQEFKDAALSEDGAIVPVAGRGKCANRISAACFEMLESNGINTCFMKVSGEREMEVKQLKLMPIDLILRNVAAGEVAKKLDVPEGEILPLSIVEFYLREDALNDPAYDHDKIDTESSVTEGEVLFLRERSVEINALLKGFFAAKGLVLVDARFKFGKDEQNRLLVCDEISPDTCRLWDKETHDKLDKDRFRQDLRGTEDAYKTVLSRMIGE